jgi:hypothetical protein
VARAEPGKWPSICAGRRSVSDGQARNPYASEGPDAVAAEFRKELDGKHGAVINASLEILRKRFAQDEKTEGYRKDGPVSVAKFELGESNEPEWRETRALRQRQVSGLIDQILARIG